MVALFRKTISMYIVISSTSRPSCSQGPKLLSAKSSTTSLCFNLQHSHRSLWTMPLALQATMRNIQAILLIVKRNSPVLLFFSQLNYVVCGGKHSSIVWHVTISTSFKPPHSHLWVFSLLPCPCGLCTAITLS